MVAVVCSRGSAHRGQRGGGGGVDCSAESLQRRRESSRNANVRKGVVSCMLSHPPRLLAMVFGVMARGHCAKQREAAIRGVRTDRPDRPLITRPCTETAKVVCVGVIRLPHAGQRRTVQTSAILVACDQSSCWCVYRESSTIAAVLAGKLHQHRAKSRHGSKLPCVANGRVPPLIVRWRAGGGGR